MELEKVDLEMIATALRHAGNEQERVAGRAGSDAGEYMETARYFWGLSARIKTLRDASSAERFVLQEGE